MFVALLCLSPSRQGGREWREGGRAREALARQRTTMLEHTHKKKKLNCFKCLQAGREWREGGRAREGQAIAASPGDARTDHKLQMVTSL